MNPLYILVGLAISSLFAGCTPPPRPYAEDELMTSGSGCTDGYDDPTWSACFDEVQANRTTCYRACGTFDACARGCNRVWRNDDCGEHEFICVAHYYYFGRANQPDVELGVACRAAMENSRGCGVEIDRDPCLVFERIERREATAVYECLADLPCGADTSVCGPPVQPYELAQQFCELARAAGHECTPDMIAFLDGSDGWLRDDVVEQLRQCEAPMGADRVRCLDAWLRAIDPLLQPSP